MILSAVRAILWMCDSMVVRSVYKIASGARFGGMLFMTKHRKETLGHAGGLLSGIGVDHPSPS